MVDLKYKFFSNQNLKLNTAEIVLIVQTKLKIMAIYLV